MGVAVGAGPTLDADGVDDDGLEDFQFGPLPELVEDLAPEPDLAGEAEEVAPAPLDEPATETPGPFRRALGLAPDPVHPDDLGLDQDGADAELPVGDQLDRELDLGGPPGRAATPPRPFAAAARDLGLERPRTARAIDDEAPLELALDLGRVAVAGPAGGVLAHGGALDLSLPAMVRPHEVRVPLRSAPARHRPAGAGRRAASWAVDVAPFVVLGAAAVVAVYGRVPASPGASADPLELAARDGGAILGPLLACVAILALVYQTLAHALAGATLGKWLLGLRLVGLDGGRPSFGRSAARAALSAASVLLLGLGLAPALFTRSGRALHDICSGTRVVEAP